MNNILIKAIDLSKSYGKVKALKEASFSIKRGTITALLGENGAGKTTTIKLLLGFLQPDAGRIEINCPMVGYVPDRPLFFSWVKGEEILDITARLYGIKREKLDQSIQEISEKIGFDPHLLERRVQTYSLGNQKKMAYLQNLIASPELLIVDEPFSGLDPVSIKLVRELFLEMKKEGKTLLLSSHLISEMEKIYDEVVIIKKGQILLEDSRQSLLYKGYSDLEALFLSLQN